MMLEESAAGFFKDYAEKFMETRGKTDLVMKLYGPDNRTRLIAEDDDAGAGLNPRISRVLPNGEYLMQIRHYNTSGGTGPYTIKVTR